MKAAILLIIAILAGCANTPRGNGRPEKVDEFASARTGGNFTAEGAIAVFDDDYRFTVILVKDLGWALESTRIADYGLPHISQFRRGDRVTPFLTFIPFVRETVDLTYCVKLQRPDGTFAPGEYHDLLVARATLFASRGYPARDFATVGFDKSDALGTYQFHIIMKDGGNVINACIMQFELTD